MASEIQHAPRRLLLVVTAAALLAALVGAAPEAVAGGGGCHQERATTSSRAGVVLADSCFRATVTQVDEAEAVTFTNKDDYAHNVVGWSGRWGSVDELGPGDSFTVTFDDPGVYPYACYLHYGMTGAIVVGDELEAGGFVGASTEAAGAGTSQPPEGESASRPEQGAPVAPVAVLAALALAAAVTAGFVLRRGPRGRKVRAEVS
jgi:plastocyanin